MRRLLFLATFALAASLFLAPAVSAQEMMEEEMKMEEPKMEMMQEDMKMEEGKMEMKMEEGKMMEKGKMEEPKMMEKEVPKTGGPLAPSLLLPLTAALLLGSGVVAYGVLRRR